jgi:hypothetical protein
MHNQYSILIDVQSSTLVEVEQRLFKFRNHLNQAQLDQARLDRLKALYDLSTIAAITDKFKTLRWGTRIATVITFEEWFERLYSELLKCKQSSKAA